MKEQLIPSTSGDLEHLKDRAQVKQQMTWSIGSICTPLTAEVCCNFSSIQVVKRLPVVPTLYSMLWLAYYASIIWHRPNNNIINQIMIIQL